MSTPWEAKKNGEVFELRRQKNLTPRLGITLLFVILIASTSIKSFVFIILPTYWKECQCIPRSGSASPLSSWLRKTTVLHSCCFLPPRETALASTIGHPSLHCLTYPGNGWHTWLGNLLGERENASLSACPTSYRIPSVLVWKGLPRLAGLCLRFVLSKFNCLKKINHILVSVINVVF